MSDTREIVRIARQGVDGTKPVEEAVTGLKGVGPTYGHAVAEQMGLDGEIIGELSDEKIDEIEERLKDPEVPEWLVNRRDDRETGEDQHLIESDLELKEEFDIRRYKEIGSYRGWRHKIGLPVRGQKTKSSFRSGDKIGVDTASIKEEASAGGEEE